MWALTRRMESVVHHICIFLSMVLNHTEQMKHVGLLVAHSHGHTICMNEVNRFDMLGALCVKLVQYLIQFDQEEGVRRRKESREIEG